MQPPERKFSYINTVRELIDNGVICPHEPYYYFDHRLKIAFDKLFLFCQENLSDVCLRDGYNIEPARFYFYDSGDVNAAASPCENGFFSIEINRGTIEELWDKFCDNDILDDPELSEYKTLNDFYERPPHSISIGFIMFQTASLFTYYHELSHLIQFSNIDSFNAALRAKLSNQLKEKNFAGDNDFDFTDHILEYDSDLHGAQESAAHVVNFFQQLPEDDRTEENLRNLIIIALVGILGFYIMLLDDPEGEIYFYETDHPHPVIRIQWIALSLIDRIKKYFIHIDIKDVTSETLRVLGVYFKHKNLGDIDKRYHQPLINNGIIVHDYILDVFRTATGPGYEYLTSNTIHTRPNV